LASSRSGLRYHMASERTHFMRSTAVLNYRRETSTDRGGCGKGKVEFQPVLAAIHTVYVADFTASLEMFTGRTTNMGPDRRVKPSETVNPLK
jgi:hypothetical protein